MLKVTKRILEQRLASLTPAQRRVFDILITAKLNKEIADALGISERTVKHHRGVIMQKMQAAHVIELVQMASKLGLYGAADG